MVCQEQVELRNPQPEVPEIALSFICRSGREVARVQFHCQERLSDLNESDPFMNRGQ